MRQPGYAIIGFMAYIRSNEDYYRSLGYGPETAEAMGRAADAGESLDEGFCNPMKQRFADEVVKSYIQDPERGLDIID